MAANKYMENTQSKKQSRLRFDWILVAILVLALFLYGWQIWKAGSANAFYTAAIKSMTESFHNFWYGSFDPAGYITVDKPPVALWFMAISAKIFGVHGWSVVLPSVLFGVGSVYLMYRIIQPYFGKNAARLSALALTLTPIVVADSRTNNMDATLVFFLMLALYFLEKAIGSRKIWSLLISFALIGIAFNVKMLQAFMILPAMYLFYWLAANETWKRKISKLVFATVSLLVFTLAYPISVDMTSASSRPYVGGSETNSLLELAFGYNGSERLLGQTTGTGGTFGAGMNSKTQKKGGGMPGSGSKQPTGTKHNGKSMTPPGGKNMKGQPNGGKKGGPGKMGAGGGGGGAFNIGTAGPFRLFQSALGPEVSWLLPFALFGLIGGLVYFRDRRKRWFNLTTKQKQLILWTGWLVPVYGFFSIASFFHPYYMIMLAPPIAALFGTGVSALVGLFRNNLRTNWKFYLLPAAIIATAALQSWYVYSYYPWLTWIILIAAIVFSIGMAILPRGKAFQTLLVGGMLSIMAAPAWWSLTPTIAAESAMIPTAGPSLLTSSSSGMPGGGGGMGNNSVNTQLLNYVEKNQGSAKYLFATSDSTTAAPYIIKTGKAVMAMGGFNGTDPAITLTQFKKLVKDGNLKYFYYSGKSGNTKIINWIKKHATKVKTSLYQSSNSTSSQPGMAGPGTTSSTKSTKGKAPTGKTTSGKAPAAGKGRPSGKPGSKPSMSRKSKMKPNKTTSKTPSKSTHKSSQGQGNMQGPGGMGSTGVLYDLSSIYK